MNKVLRIYRLIDKVMAYAKSEAGTDLPYGAVKETVAAYCSRCPRSMFKTHVGDDHAARQIASDLTGVKIW